MTPRPLTVLATDSCTHVRRRLGDDWTDEIPVVSAQGLFVGVLRRGALARARHSDSNHGSGATRISAVMDHRAFTVAVDDDLAAAQALMEVREVDRLPVVDDHMHVVGLLERPAPRPRRGASRPWKEP